MSWYRWLDRVYSLDSTVFRYDKDNEYIIVPLEFDDGYAELSIRDRGNRWVTESIFYPRLGWENLDRVYRYVWRTVGYGMQVFEIHGYRGPEVYEFYLNEYLSNYSGTCGEMIGVYNRKEWLGLSEDEKEAKRRESVRRMHSIH